MTEKKYFNAAVLKSELDGYVLGQDEGARRVAMAVTSHLYRISAHERNKNSRVRKDNVLLAGPTGCGKTETFRVLQRLEERMGIPVIMRNAPDYSPNDTWKGSKDLSCLIQDLCQEAIDLYTRMCHAPRTEEDYDAVCRLAGNGIILLDEFDKMRITENTGTSIFCRDYQAALLKMTEGSEYLAGEVNLTDPVRYDGEENPYELKVNTSGVMFVFLGAFDGMERITRNRLLAERRKQEEIASPEKEEERRGIGFTAELKPACGTEDSAVKTELSADADLTPNLEDMISYGILRELAGRLAIRINYRPLSVANLVKIMKESKTSVFHEYQERFENMGHRLSLDQSAFREIARIATERKTGARGLNNIFSDLLLSTMYTLSDTVEPMECLLRGSDIKRHRPPVLRRIPKQGSNRVGILQGA
ncbi:MAG: AAA family ATPase [Acidaminococcaceae bacterium]|nr:AAA family ATPase [Acidaminococcaceae bacterium]